MSDLTNCVKVLLIDRRHLSRKILLKSLRLLYHRHALNLDTPTLLFPSDFAEQTAIPVEKNYSLWILNTRHSDKYFGFLSKMFKLVRE